MNFKQFLLNEDTLGILVDTLKKDCSQFIAESKKLPVYRGMDLELEYKVPNVPFLYKYKTQKNREPLVGNKKTYFDIFNKLFENKYGIKNVRAQSILTTGDEYKAGDYGELSLFFPIGNYTYWWSPEVVDAYEVYQSSRQGNFLDTKESDLKLMSQIVSNYTNKNLVGAIKSENEILFQCDYFYLIPADIITDDKFKEIVNEL